MDFWETLDAAIGSAGNIRDTFKPDPKPQAPVLIVEEEPAIDPILLALGAAALVAVVMSAK